MSAAIFTTSNWPVFSYQIDAEHQLARRRGRRNRMGEIIIDAKCETNVKGVFAAGDCTTVPYKQIIIATGEGAKASPD